MPILYKEIPIYSQDLQVLENIMNPLALQLQIIDKLQQKLYKELEKEVPDSAEVTWLEARITAASEAYKNMKQ